MFKSVLYKENPDVVIPRKFLETDVYAAALEAFVLVCTDCVFFNESRRTFFLAKRKSKPMSDWWFIGGRSFAGEDEVTSVKRCVKRETGLELDIHRFKFLTMKRYFFKDRQQPPQNKGCDSLCYIFGVGLEDKEVELVKSNLDPKEYDTAAGLKEFGPEDLSKENVFPAIMDLYEYVFNVPVQRSGRWEEKDTWIVLYGRGDPFSWSLVRILNKPELSERWLKDIIPKEKNMDAEQLLKGSKVEDVWCWSELSKLLGHTLFLRLQSSHGVNIIARYYNVFPDGTVEHFSMIDQNKKQERRMVRNREIREFSICRTIVENTSWDFVPVPLEGVD